MDEEISEIRKSAQSIMELNEYYEKSLEAPANSREDAIATKKELASIRMEILKHTFAIKKEIQNLEKKTAQNA